MFGRSLIQKAIHVWICQEVFCEKLQMVKLSKGDGDSSSKGYKVHDGDCSFSASIDADGYVTIFGIRKFVGLNAKGVYKKTFYGVRRDCELNGTFLCKPHTCAKFWLDMK